MRSWNQRGAYHKWREARQGPRMTFGPFAVKTSFGKPTIASAETAMRFVRSLSPSYRTTYHWKVPERMLEVAWTYVEAEEFAAKSLQNRS